MQIKIREAVAFAVVFLGLLTGTVIYYSFRKASVFGTVVPEAFKDNLFQSFSPVEWVVYSLPDALWMFSLSLFILTVWEFRLKAGALFWLVTAGITGILLESLQYTGLIPGTFDRLDLILTAIAAVLPLFFVLKPHKEMDSKKGTFFMQNT